MGGIDGGGLLIGPDGMAPTLLLVCLPLVILPITIKSRRSFFLAPPNPGGAGKKGRKTVVVWRWWYTQ